MMGSVAPVLFMALLLGAGGPAFGQTPDSSNEPPPLNNHELLKKYVWDALGPSGAIHATLESALDQWNHSPDAWSQDEYGYAQRWASEYAAAAIGSTTKYGVARLM